MPYIACQGQSCVLEWAMKAPDDDLSPFQWSRVVFNLPTEQWDPSLPRVMLIRKDGELAVRLVPATRGVDVTNAVKTDHFLKTRRNSVANQASEEKYRKPTASPGAWKGKIMNTSEPLPHKSTNAKKWNRFKSGINWVLEQSETQEFVPTAEL